MSKPLADRGELMAYEAALECPACYICDAEIPFLKDVTWTTRNKPVCRECVEALDEMIREREQRRRREEQADNVGEGRSSNLLRQPRTNYHE